MTAQDISVVPLIADRVYLLNKHVVAVGKTREILTNVELLRKNGLDAPPFVEFALKLGLNPLPLTVDEAVRSVRKLIESGGKEKEEEANESD